MRHQLGRLLGADPAWRALAAALILEELHQVKSHRLHIVLVGQNDNRVGAYEAAVFFQRAEIERQVGHGFRQDAARSAARQIGLEAVAVGHAAAELVDQLAYRDAGRRKFHARILDPAGHRKAAEAFALMAALRRDPLRASLDDVADPIERLDILLEGRAAEQADLRHVRRAMPRQAALAFDRFDYRRFFTADISAGAAAQMNLAETIEVGVFELLDLLDQHQPQFGIFVADIEVDFGGLDHPGGDQHAFKETVRIEPEIVAILERAGLALVCIHR